ncbi:MAG: hypothetical protein AB7S48_00785 [Bacteroidales bacterium]
MPKLNLSKFEKIVVILVLIVGVLGGIILIYIRNTPPILIAILFSMSIATLVYHFLGGIKNAQLNTGAIKLGGTMAALLSSILLLNKPLEKQLNSISTNETYFINSKSEIVTSNNKVIGKINLDNYTLTLDKDLNVLACDSIKLGKLNLTNFSITSDYKIITADSVILGSLSKKGLMALGVINKLEVKNYTEVKFNTHLNNPFDYKIDQEAWDDVNGYRGIYNALPFKIEPCLINTTFKTKVIIDNSEKTYPLMRNESIFFTNSTDNEKHIFVIRIRQLQESKSWDTYNNFVQYQIFEFITNTF